MKIPPEFFGVEEYRPLQEQAIQVLETSDRNTLIVAETGMGKTLIAYYLFALTGEGFLIEPTRALCYEKSTQLSAIFGRENVIIINKDYSATLQDIKKTPIKVITPHKLTHYLSDLDLKQKPVVVDEIHTLRNNPEIEVILSRIKEQGARIVGLSATLNDQDTQRLAKWLDAIVITPKEKRPVPLYYKTVKLEYTVGPEGQLSIKTPIGFFDNANDFIAKYTLTLDGGILVWVPTRNGCDEMAKRIAREKGEITPWLSKNVVVTNQSDEALAESIEAGVGIHHGGLSKENRELVQNLFKQRRLWCVITGYTLAQGVNLPARHVVLTTLFETPEKLIDPSTFHQFSGRAGRPGYDPYGVVHIVTQGESEQVYLEEYLLKTKATPLESKLANDWFLTKTVMNLAYMKGSIEKVLTFFDNTFYATTRGEEGVKELHEKYLEIIRRLEEKGVFKTEQDEIRFPQESWRVAAKLSMHPEEVALALELNQLNYKQFITRAVERIVTPQMTQAFNPDEIIEMGLLVYEASKSYGAREAADLTQSYIDTVTLFYARLEGWDSPNTKKAREVAEAFVYANNPKIKELQKVLGYPAVKRLIRNVPRTLFNPKPSEEEIQHVVNVAFPPNQNPDPEKVKKVEKILRGGMS